MESSKLMKPLFYGNFFNRDGRRMRAVLEKTVSDGTNEYRLWCGADAVDERYGGSEARRAYLDELRRTEGMEAYVAALDEERAEIGLGSDPARQQGYTKTKLWRALREGDMADPKGFLESCRVECANLPSAMATVTFLVRMTLEQLIELNRCVRLQDRNGRNYDASRNPYCGYIVLGKDTMCGLFDPWSGGGSVLEIQLERNVRIPISI